MPDLCSEPAYELGRTSEAVSKPLARLQVTCLCSCLMRAEHTAVAQVIDRREGCKIFDVPVTEIQA